MDIMTLVYLALIAFGGVTYDVYRNPQTLQVQIVAPGSKLEPSVDKSFIALVVHGELDRIAKLRSLLAHAAIKSVDDKDLTETIADAIGGAELVSALSSTIADEPNTLKFAIYNESDNKVTMYVSGRSKKPDFGEERFDISIRQQDGETPVELMKRSAIEAAAHIDPYLAMLYLIQKGNDSGYQAFYDRALTIAERINSRYPGNRHLLLARLTNLAGIVEFGRGDYQAARDAFAAALKRMPEGDIGPTFVLATENLAFAEIALGRFDAATTAIDGLMATTEDVGKLLGYKSVSTEGVAFHVEQADVNRMLVTALQLKAAAAMGGKDYQGAEQLLGKALRIEPGRITALWLLANLHDLRCDRPNGDRVRATIPDLKRTADPYLEYATAWSSLYFAENKVTVLPSLYAAGALPQIPNP